MGPSNPVVSPGHKASAVNSGCELFAEGMTVREVATTLRISKSEAGRLRIRAFNDGLLDQNRELNNDKKSNETIQCLGSGPTYITTMMTSTRSATATQLVLNDIEIGSPLEGRRLT